MPRPRLPQAKAEASGAAVKNPARFKGRKAPKLPPLGEPYARMTDAQKAVWQDMRADMPWLNRGHRLLVRTACMLAARMDEEEGGVIGVSAAQALASILSKLGATPVDETKVTHGDDEEAEGAFDFGRPN